MNVSILKTLTLAICITTMATCMILFPEESFDAALRGLNMWWEIVFPSLFPFFVISELLIGFGVVMFMGILLEPLMRPLFNVPGVGGFAWAMGMATGFPAGAKITARLRKENQLTRFEAERLVSFTNSSSPLFIFGAVSVGFFHNAHLGIMLVIAHYLGNFIVGLIMRFHGTDKSIDSTSSPRRPHFKQALVAMHRTRIQNKKPLGKLMGDAVTSSIQTLLMIGGFIILFSVINKLLFHLKITALLGDLMNFFLTLLQLPEQLSIPLIAGLFEITLGSQMTSEVAQAGLMEQVIMVSFILGFSGFSVQAQVASILAQTDIRYSPFFMARILHGFIAGIITYVCWKPFESHFLRSKEEMAVPAFQSSYQLWWERVADALYTFGPLFTLVSLVIYIIIIAKRMNAK